MGGRRGCRWTYLPQRGGRDPRVRRTCLGGLAQSQRCRVRADARWTGRPVADPVVLEQPAPYGGHHAGTGRARARRRRAAPGRVPPPGVAVLSFTSGEGAPLGRPLRVRGTPPG